MQICCVVGAFPSLSETFILNQITGLIDAGHEVFIYAGARSDETIMHQDVLRYGLLSRTQFYQDRPRPYLMRLVKFCAAFPGAFRRAPGAVLRSLDMFRYGREALSLNLFFRACAFLDVKDADIVFCHFGPNGLAALQMKELGVLTGKLTVAFHASDMTAYVRRHGGNVYKKLFLKGDCFLPISAYAASKLVGLGCPEKKICIHPMGVEMPAINGMTGERLKDGALRILSVARLVDKKGIGYALMAVARLRDEGFSCFYTIAGDGPLHEALQARVRELRLEAEVRFLGWQDAASVRALLQEADVLLAPSILADNGDEEGVPVVIMEAMAAGVPVVTTATGGIGELVADGKNGFIVPEKDGVALAAMLKRVCRDALQTTAVVGAARRAIEQRHNIKTLNIVLEHIFCDLAACGVAKDPGIRKNL